MLGIETNKLLSLKKKTAISGPYACVSNANIKALRISEIAPTLTPRYYIIICAGLTSNCKMNVMMNNRNKPGYCL